MTRFTLRRSQWGYSLFHDGQLVASADHWLPLVHYVATLQQRNGVMA